MTVMTAPLETQFLMSDASFLVLLLVAFAVGGPLWFFVGRAGSSTPARPSGHRVLGG